MIKNKAFTMSEALIVLGIVAVLAVLSVVAVNNSKPDENIIMFRRAYSTTAKIIKDMLNDKDLYPNAEEQAKDYDNDPDMVFGSTNSVKGFMDYVITDEMKQKFSYLDTSAGRKFAIVFAYKSNAIDISDTSDSTKVFTTPDGIYWKLEDCFITGGYACGSQGPNRPGMHILPPEFGNYAYERYALITAYLNGANTDKSCRYSESCPYPTEFNFLVLPNGNVTPILGENKSAIDPMACSYLRYPKAVRNSQIPTDPSVNTCFEN